MYVLPAYKLKLKTFGTLMQAVFLTRLLLWLYHLADIALSIPFF